MAIELCISVRSGRNDGAVKKRGDILVAKLSGSPWGSEELRLQAIVRLTDDCIANISDSYLKGKIQAIEARLVQMLTNGEPHPVITLPTAQHGQKTTHDASGGEHRHNRLLQRSRIFLNFTLANPQLTAQWLDKEVSVPVQEVPANRINATVRYRGNPSVEADETLVNAEDSY